MLTPTFSRLLPSKNKGEFNVNPDVFKASAYLKEHSKGETVV